MSKKKWNFKFIFSIGIKIVKLNYNIMSINIIIYKISVDGN